MNLSPLLLLLNLHYCCSWMNLIYMIILFDKHFPCSFWSRNWCNRKGERNWCKFDHLYNLPIWNFHGQILTTKLTTEETTKRQGFYYHYYIYMYNRLFHWVSEVVLVLSCEVAFPPKVIFLLQASYKLDPCLVENVDFDSSKQMPILQSR